MNKPPGKESRSITKNFNIVKPESSPKTISDNNNDFESFLKLMCLSTVESNTIRKRKTNNSEIVNSSLVKSRKVQKSQSSCNEFKAWNILRDRPSSLKKSKEIGEASKSSNDFSTWMDCLVSPQRIKNKENIKPLTNQRLVCTKSTSTHKESNSKLNTSFESSHRSVSTQTSPARSIVLSYSQGRQESYIEKENFTQVLTGEQSIFKSVDLCDSSQESEDMDIVLDEILSQLSTSSTSFDSLQTSNLSQENNSTFSNESVFDGISTQCTYFKNSILKSVSQSSKIVEKNIKKSGVVSSNIFKPVSGLYNSSQGTVVKEYTMTTPQLDRSYSFERMETIICSQPFSDNSPTRPTTNTVTGTQKKSKSSQKSASTVKKKVNKPKTVSSKVVKPASDSYISSQRSELSVASNVENIMTPSWDGKNNNSERIGTICRRRVVPGSSSLVQLNRKKTENENLRNINILRILSEDMTVYSNSKNSFRMLSNIHKIGTEKWLNSAISELPAIRKLRKPELIEICPSFNRIITIKSQGSVKRFRKENVRIYRCDILKLKTIKKELDTESFLEKLTQSSINRDDWYTDRIISPLSVTSSLIPDDDDQLEKISMSVAPNDTLLQRGLDKILRDYETGVNEDVDFNVNQEELKRLINDIFLQVFEGFENGQVPVFAIRKRESANCVIENNRLTLKSEASMTRVNFSRSNSRFKFCLMLYILGKVYLLLDGNTKLTKREIYYQVKHLVRNQPQLDRAITEICCLLNVGQWHLNIVSHKGLVYGDLQIVFSSKEIVDCNSSATLIPLDIEDIVELRSRAYFILIVEKESIFHKLLQENLPNRLSRPFIMVTGKGVPDFNTQLFIKKISTIMSLPVFIVVDADPDGVRIMMNYRYGSVSSSYLSQYLAVPRARWLGVFPSEITTFGINNKEMTARDRKMCQKLLKSPYMEDNPKIVKELEVLMNRNKKAAIEGLIKNNTFLSKVYLPSKFSNNDFI